MKPRHRFVRHVRRFSRHKTTRNAARAVSGWTKVSALAIVFALAVSAAVSAYYQRRPLPEGLEDQVTVLSGASVVRFWGDEVPGDLAAAVARWIPHMPRLARTAPKNGPVPEVTYLALSGGGSDGAFGAGLLTGWSLSGRRPRFEIVTGVSAGALIAPFAFLGSDYDAALKEVWTSYGTREVAPRRFLGLLGGPSFADTTPLRRIIARYITQDMLTRIAAEYRKGRLLLVVTTNLDLQRPVVWNIGEIAESGHANALDLTHQVLMASAAIPGLFPPVNIRVTAPDGRTYDEMHVDGGVTREVFVAPAQLSFRAFDPFYPEPPKRRIFIIKNGKTEPEYTAAKASSLSIIERALLTMIKSHQLGDIYRIYRMAKDDDVDFNVAAVPTSFTVKARETFDKSYLAALFDVGVKLGQSEKPWLKEPPEYRPLATGAPSNLAK